MSRKSRKRVTAIADWEISDAAVNGWFWPEILAARKRKARRPYIHRLKVLRRIMEPVISFNSLSF